MAIELEMRDYHFNSLETRNYHFSNLECCAQHISLLSHGNMYRREFFDRIRTYFCQNCFRQEYRWWSDTLLGLPPTYGPISWENPCRGCNQRTTYLRGDLMVDAMARAHISRNLPA
jgi:hypothetical protein